MLDKTTLIDLALQQAARADDALIDAVQDQVSYRFIASWALSAYAFQLQRANRLEQQLLDLRGVRNDTEG